MYAHAHPYNKLKDTQRNSLSLSHAGTHTHTHTRDKTSVMEDKQRGKAGEIIRNMNVWYL